MVFRILVPNNWTDFLPPPPEHPPPLPANNCNANLCHGMGPTSPTSIRRAAQRAPSGMSNHQRYALPGTLHVLGKQFLIGMFNSSVFSMLASSQCSGQSGISCGGNTAGYSPWGPPVPHPFMPGENFYNNPVQYPSANGNGHRYNAMTPNGQQPSAAPYFHQTPAGRSLHNHYPTSHGHATEYQPFQQNGRKCNGR